MKGKIILKTIIFIFVPLFFNISCYTNYKLLENSKRVLPEARIFIEENASYLDTLRYGEYAKNRMRVEYRRGRMGLDANKFGWIPYVSFYISDEKYNILLDSEEINEYLPRNEIDAILHLLGLGLVEPKDIRNHFYYILHSYEINQIDTVIVINNIIVFINTEPRTIKPKYYYMEQVGDYYVQVEAY